MYFLIDVHRLRKTCLIAITLFFAQTFYKRNSDVNLSTKLILDNLQKDFLLMKLTTKVFVIFSTIIGKLLIE